MLDTGFTELLAVNSQDLEALGWRYWRDRQMQTAQGKPFLGFIWERYAQLNSVDV